MCEALKHSYYGGDCFLFVRLFVLTDSSRKVYSLWEFDLPVV